VRAVGKYAASDLMLAGWRTSGQRAYEVGIAAEATGDLDAAIAARARACLKTSTLRRPQSQ
jgi:enoyl-CoA hydratase